mmetsp:Transcript_54364/g.101604  ORF Transcript_54364/g.101604 Transcript_54364/m.101604 type:complete len:284 (-) Transcript_54364:18-869(-)
MRAAALALACAHSSAWDCALRSRLMLSRSAASSTARFFSSFDRRFGFVLLSVSSAVAATVAVAGAPWSPPSPPAPSPPAAAATTPSSMMRALPSSPSPSPSSSSSSSSLDASSMSLPFPSERWPVPAAPVLARGLSLFVAPSLSLSSSSSSFVVVVAVAAVVKASSSFASPPSALSPSSAAAAVGAVLDWVALSDASALLTSNLARLSNVGEHDDTSMPALSCWAARAAPCFEACNAAFSFFSSFAMSPATAAAARVLFSELCSAFTCAEALASLASVAASVA